MNLFSIKGTLIINNNEIVFTGKQDEDAQAFVLLEQAILDTFKQVTYGRTNNEIKIPLSIKLSNVVGIYNDESGVCETKFSKQADLISELVKAGLVSSNVDFIQWVNNSILPTPKEELEKNNQVEYDFNDDVTDLPEYLMDYYVECDKLQVEMKDGSSFKTLKSGSIKANGEVIEKSAIVHWISNLIDANLVENLSGVFSLYTAENYQQEEGAFIQVKIDSLDNFKQTAELLNLQKRQQLVTLSDVYAGLSAKLLNLQAVPLIGLSQIVCGTAQVTDEEGEVSYYMVDRNKFFKINSKGKQNIAKFEDWYKEIKDHHKAGAEIQYVPTRYNNEFVQGFVVEHLDGAIDIVASPAQLRTLIIKSKNSVVGDFIKDIESYKAQHQEVIDWLNDVQAEALELVNEGKVETAYTFNEVETDTMEAETEAEAEETEE